MNYNLYPQVLAESDEYITLRSGKKILFINPTISFYAKLLKIVLISFLQAKKKKYNDYNWVAASLNVMHSLEDVGVRFHISGMNNLKKFEGPAIFVANHMSAMETMVLPCIIQPIKPVVYVIKQELVDFPLFGRVASARHPIIVGRQNPREDMEIVLREGSKKLQEGKSIIIFPQKTRTEYFNIGSFNSLGTKLAKKNDVHLLPIALFTNAWANGKMKKDFGKIDPSKEVKIAIGESLKIKRSGSEEHQLTIEFIKKKFNEWGNESYIQE